MKKKNSHVIISAVAGAVGTIIAVAVLEMWDQRTWNKAEKDAEKDVYIMGTKTNFRIVDSA